MTSNLLLVLGPLLGLFVARLFGPWRPLPALAGAAIGQIVVFSSYVCWQQYRMTHPAAGRETGVRGVARITPTLGGRLMAITALLMIAAVIAALALAAQAFASRPANGPPPAV